jgi:hypothetical protein
MSELEFLKTFAATARRGGFGPPGFRCDGTTGEYRRIGNKTGATMNGQRPAATVADVMVGYQRIEKGKSPIYIVGRVSDGYVRPAREELGDLPATGEKDPWEPASWLPFWDVESREVLIFHAANDGSRDAVASLAGAFADNREAHPDQINHDPLIELNAGHYDGQHRRIFYPIFDIVDWIERPAALLRVIPPPVKVLDLKALPPAQSDQHEPVAVKAEPKKAIAPGRARDMDDEIPFAPEWRG